MNNFLRLGLLLLSPLSHVAAFTISSTTTIQGRSVEELHTFLATPTNWPAIVLSSVGVEEAAADGDTRRRTNAIDRPLRKGERVTELFGLPPVLPLAVTWTCRENALSRPGRRRAGVGRLEFASATGLAGVAENCCMRFDIAEAAEGGTRVDMTVDVDPVSPLANLAPLVLQVDNDLALKVLLPRALKKA